ncbi:Spy/CpxP family protein refolding chaperone [Aquabacter spiritensis]|uniref:LTXXQ motif family protein n=1 Tax=Aquabacter spiritensis TaxID=933073 RepID=A0A4R3LY01_9HYPH|nr:Spy/CpxP family protein refolding chaperone [Aquabacter spiritensis]TCT05561.1 LTXXQ motif family protein [Aquabacter spiritensis]
MKKTVIAATAAALIAGSAIAYAANPGPAGGPPGGPPAAGQDAGRDAGPRWKPTQEDRAALLDARIAALKAGLKLTPDQDKLWPAVEAALRDTAKDAVARRAERADRPRSAEPDPIARLRFQADMMTKRAADLTKIADAAGPLYQTLDDGQKHRLQILLRKEFRAMGPHGGPHGPQGGPPGPRRG